MALVPAQGRCVAGVVEMHVLSRKRVCQVGRTVSPLSRPVHVAAMLDPQDDDLARVLVDAVKHAVGAPAS